MEKDNRELPSSKDMDMLSQETDYVIGQDNIQIYGLDVHNPVFAMSAALVLIFSSLASSFSRNIYINFSGDSRPYP